MSEVNLISLLAFLAAAFCVGAMHRRLLVGVGVALLVTMVSWPFVSAADSRGVDRELAAIQTRHERGEYVSDEDRAYDGVGDRWGGLIMGWFPGAAGGAVAACVILIVRASRNPQKPLIGPRRQPLGDGVR